MTDPKRDSVNGACDRIEAEDVHRPGQIGVAWLRHRRDAGWKS